AIVRRPGHLIALVLAPLGQRDAPIARGGVRRRQVAREPALVRGGQRLMPLLDEGLLPRGEGAVQRQIELPEARWQVTLGLEPGRRRIHPWIRHVTRA